MITISNDELDRMSIDELEQYAGEILYYLHRLLERIGNLIEGKETIK
jgi:hypothetical protein